jgi:hypothetical protein
MTSESKDAAPAPPELIPPPGPPAVDSKEPGYRPAAQDIDNIDQLKMVENFIGSIYGEARQIDKSNIGDNQYTRGVKFDAEKEIKTLRADTKARHTGQASPTPSLQNTQQVQQHVPPPIPPPEMNYPQQPAQINMPIPTGDSLILKHEIDEIKKNIVDIKKLYDEFFKLKTVKGKWIIAHDEKTVTTTTVAKTWNVLNKLLKNKTGHITIDYKE